MDNQKTRDTLLGIATLWKERDSQDPLHHRFRLSHEGIHLLTLTCSPVNQKASMQAACHAIRTPCQGETYSNLAVSGSTDT